eukprot:12603095-Prorocentrum_lima.AAC.1
MKRVLNAESGPDLVISNAAELSFSMCAMGACWESSPRLNSIFHSGYLPPYPPSLLPTMTVQQVF